MSEANADMRDMRVIYLSHPRPSINYDAADMFIPGPTYFSEV